MATITVSTPESEKEAIEAAAAARGMSTAAYMRLAARRQMTRDAAEIYKQVLAGNPAFAAEVAEGRRIALENAATVRGRRTEELGEAA